MSYCVNCGVELDTSARECPLCNTPVWNPRELEKQAVQGRPGMQAGSPFPGEKSQVEAANKKDFGLLMSMVVLATAATCGILNLLVFRGTLWSLSVIGACAVLWVMLIPVMIYTKQSVYVSLLYDGAVSLYTDVSGGQQGVVLWTGAADHSAGDCYRRGGGSVHLQAAKVFPDSVTVPVYRCRAALPGAGDADRLVSAGGDRAELVGGGTYRLCHIGYCADYHAFPKAPQE